MRNAVNLLILTWLLVCLALLCGGLAVTLAPGEMVWAWPVPGGAASAALWTRPVALALAVVAALLLAIAVNFAKTGGRARPWAELVLYFGGLFGFVWWVLGPGLPGPAQWIAGGVLLLAAAWLKFRLRRPRPAPPPARTWLWADALLILAPVAVGLALGHRPEGPSVWVSLLFYPLYAGVQLLVFLVVPADRLQILRATPRVAAAACAGLFALIHWPNPVVMLITALAMALWAAQYRRGRPLWQLALVMGLAATTTTQFLPDSATRHMRVGPRYVRQETTRQYADAYPTHSRVPVDIFLAEVFAPCVGRAPSEAEIAALDQTLDAAARPVTAWHFFISTEYGMKADGRGLPPSPHPDQPWTTLSPEWQARIRDLALRGAPLDWPDYIAFLYEEVLGRSAAPAEIAGWPPALNWSRRKQVTEALLNWRLAHGPRQPVAITSADLLLVQ